MSLVIPSGSNTVMRVSTAPLGWVKTNTFHKNVMRVVTGPASSGGTFDYDIVLTNQITNVTTISATVGSTTLTTSTTAAHTHPYGGISSTQRISNSPLTGTGFTGPTSTPGNTTQATGTLGGHTHTASADVPSLILTPLQSYDLFLKYVDNIIVQRS
jgi:hypothetical protein